MGNFGDDTDQAPDSQGGRIVPLGKGGVPAIPVAGSYGPAGYGTTQDDGSAIVQQTLQYLHVAFKRKWIILSIMLAVVTLGTLKALMTTPRYTSNVRIQIDREPLKVVEHGLTDPQEEGGLDFLKTQFELLKSRAMAARVVSSLHLEQDQNFLASGRTGLLGSIRSFFAGQGTETPSVTELEDRAILLIASNVEVKPLIGSRLVDLSYTDPSPLRAKNIAAAYGEAYLASNIDKRFQASAHAKIFLEDQLRQLKSRLEMSEKEALDFAEREKIVEVNDKASVAENNLAAANVAIGTLISERIKNEQQWRQVENASAIDLPQFLSNKVIDELRGHRKALETEYQEKLESFKPSYPAMQQITTKIKEIDKQLNSEHSTIRKSLKAAYEAALAQEVEMKRRIEQLREVAIDLQKKNIQYNIIRREVDTNRSLYNSLLQRYKEVDIAGGSGTTNIFIADPAVIPAAPSEPNLPRTILFSLVIGIVLAGGVAYLLEVLDDRVRSSEEIEQLSGLTTLGIIPRIQEETVTEALADPRSSLAEAYRSLATALQFSTASGLPKSLTVTSAGPSEGKSVTAIAIARYFAQMGLRVLLVDADLRKPSLHAKLQMNNSIGLSNYLTGSALPPEIAQKTDHSNLVFMASGPLPPNAADLLGGTRLYSLISLGSEVFDLIVFDSPPILGLADAQLLSRAVAATIFVVGSGDAGRGTIRAALRRLQLARVTPIGAVLTKFDPRTVGYGYGRHYGYGSYGYGYGYGYGNETYARQQALEGEDNKKRIPVSGRNV